MNEFNKCIDKVTEEVFLPRIVRSIVRYDTLVTNILYKNWEDRLVENIKYYSLKNKIKRLLNRIVYFFID